MSGCTSSQLQPERTLRVRVPRSGPTGAQIKINDTCLPFHDRLVHSEHRFLGCPLRSVSVRSRLEIGFEDRLQDELERTLDHTVTNGGNRKNADLIAPVLRDLLLSYPRGLIRVLDQFVLNLFQKTFPSAFLNGFKRHPVDPRSSVITFRHPVGFLERFHLADVNVQSPETPSRFSLRLDV